jgi:hypothetical protein
MTEMYAIDIAEKTHGNLDVFGEMLDWLRDVVGPQIREDQKGSVVTEERATRTYRIEGTGWYYEYCSIRIRIEDTLDFELPKFFHYASNKAGGSHLYTSKIMYIEDITRAVEFKLKW